MVQSSTVKQIAELEAQLHAQGAGPRHVAHLLRLWVQALPQGPRKRQPEHFLPLAVRHGLAGWQAALAGLATLHQRHPAEDGSERLLIKLSDGQTVESVLLGPERIPGLCVSTQVGCAVGCGFCMTGQGGLLRQLGSAEIVAQLALARTLRPVKKVVFMGMGEPAHNLEAVLEAIELMGTLGNIGHKNLVFSTVGDPRAFERLMALREGQVRPALALSLHTTKPALRETLLPRAARITPAELVAAGQAYAKASAYPIQYQWTLLEGVNDGDDEIEGIVQLLQGQYALLNLIPYNAVPGLPWKRPSWERAAEMARRLHRRGILTKLRHSAGQDVDGGCGQLRARSDSGEARLSAAAARRIAIQPG
jgi:23S rRNA (adenine2503-C2)-methyltransferase